MAMVTEKTGLGRIEELCNKFPEIPRSIIIKTDVYVQGCTWNEDIVTIGKWATPEQRLVYEFGKTDGLWKEYVNPDGFVEVPVAAILRDGTPIKPVAYLDGPYTIKDMGYGQYKLYRDGEPVDEVFFTPRMKWLSKTTQKGIPLTAILHQISNECLNGCVLRHCQYFNTDDDCRFCSFDPTYKGDLEGGLKRLMSLNPEDVFEAITIVAKEGKIRHLNLSGGALVNTSLEAEAYVRIFRAAKKALDELGIQTEFRATCQAFKREDNEKLKEAGVQNVITPMEVWDEKLFPVIAPGKAKFIGRENWMRRMVDAVEVFGRGHVDSNFVLGAELIPPLSEGGKTYDEGIKSVLEGYEWCLQNGIKPRHTFFWRSTGSKYENARVGSTEYYLTIGYERYKLVNKYNMHHKHDDPVGTGYCYKCKWFMTDIDHHRLLDGCTCSECT